VLPQVNFYQQHKLGHYPEDIKLEPYNIIEVECPKGKRCFNGSLPPGFEIL